MTLDPHSDDCVVLSTSEECSWGGLHTNLRYASGGEVALRTYAGSWNNPISNRRITEMLPFEGYALFNDASSGTLLIDPDLPVSASALAKTPASAAEDIHWSIEILARVQHQEIPTDFELSQNYPNPFNPVTSIRYGLPHEERVTLRIFNILGEKVATLLNDGSRAAGYHVAIRDGRDQYSRQVASGVYVYQIVMGDRRETRKMVLVR